MINSFSILQNDNSLFGRCYSIAIGAPNQTSALLYGFAPPKLNSPIRIKFDIDKNSLGTSNKAKMEIYNLSIQSRQAFKKGYIVQLKVGYQNIIDTIFTGNVLTNGIGSTRNGADIITTIECGDGESSIVMARLDQSYPAGVSVFQILKDCAAAMNLEDSFNPEGVGSGIIIGVTNSVYNKGFNASGAVSDTLDKVLKPQGLEWSVQNGNLNIVPKTGHNGQTAIVISKKTGLIGVPSSNDQVTKFNSLINPRLIPGALVKLESDNTSLNGFYRVRRSHFEGDTWDNKWQVECECILMNNVVQNFTNLNLLSGNLV